MRVRMRVSGVLAMKNRDTYDRMNLDVAEQMLADPTLDPADFRLQWARRVIARLRPDFDPTEPKGPKSIP